MFRAIFISVLLLLFQAQFCVGSEHRNPSYSPPKMMIEDTFSEAKHYVTAEQINLSPEGIFIFLGDTYLKIESISKDIQGFYYLEDDEEEGMYWVCNWCRAFNSYDRSTCRRCGNSYGSSPPPKNK